MGGAVLGTRASSIISIIDNDAPDNDQKSFTINFKKGLNLISEPFAITQPQTIDEYLTPVISKIVIIWKYDASTQQWTSYVPGAMYNDVIALDEKSCYRIQMSDDDSMTVYGTINSNEVIPLYFGENGTNYIGHPSLNSNLPEVEFSSIAGKYSIVWGYDASAQVWTSYVPGAQDNDLLLIEPGKGYIIIVKEDANYIVE
jgi:hypothetical protein